MESISGMSFVQGGMGGKEAPSLRSQWRSAVFTGVITMSLLFVSTLASAAKTAEHYVEEARQLFQAGDLASAAVSYQKALKLDQSNPTARRELRNVLIESKRQDPEGEYSEAEWALLEEGRKTAAGGTMQASDHSSSDIEIE